VRESSGMVEAQLVRDMRLGKANDDRSQLVSKVVVKFAEGHDVRVSICALPGGLAGAGVKEALV